MGSEMSCPCSRPAIYEDEQPETLDPIDKFKLSQLKSEELLYEYIYLTSKICLIKTEQLEAFFESRNLLTLPNNKELNYYYNMVHLTNFMGKSEHLLVYLQYSKSNLDKSLQNAFVVKNKKNKYQSTADYKSKYKVEFLNLVSEDRSKIVEQLLNDLNIKKNDQLMFMGIVNDSHKHGKNYKLLYRASLNKTLFDMEYAVDIVEASITEDLLNEVLEKHSNKLLRSIMIDYPKKNRDSKGMKDPGAMNLFFIFEKSYGTDEGFDYLVVKLEKETLYHNDIFISDIAGKLNDFQKEYKLCCFVSHMNTLYLILCGSSLAYEMNDDD